MNTPNANPKATQFSEELNALLNKYQYSLVPELQYNKTGIVAVLGIRDTLPPKEVAPELPPKSAKVMKKGKK